MRDLIQAAQVGDMQARNMLLAAVRPLLREWAEESLGSLLATRCDPSDLTQETLLEIHNKLDAFLGKTDQEFYAWVRQTLKHNILDAARRAQAQKRDVRREHRIAGSTANDEKTYQDPASKELGPQETAELKDFVQAITTHGLDNLPKAQCDALRWIYLEGLSRAEAIGLSSKSPEAFEKDLQRGRARLEELFSTSPQIKQPQAAVNAPIASSTTDGDTPPGTVTSRES